MGCSSETKPVPDGQADRAGSQHELKLVTAAQQGSLGQEAWTCWSLGSGRGNPCTLVGKGL